MSLHFSFVNVDRSIALEKHAQEKLRSLLGKYVTKPVTARVTFSQLRRDKKCIVNYLVAMVLDCTLKQPMEVFTAQSIKL